MKNDKAMVAENMRAMKHRGMSEKDAVMASMKRSKQAKGKANKGMTASPMPEEDYPYSTRMDLDGEMMDKLGLKKLKHGQKVQIHAKGHVHSTSEDTGSNGKTNRRATVQMTHMKIGC